MGAGTPAKKNRRGPFRERIIRQGDIVVTSVAGHYAIGRVTADGHTQESLGSSANRTEALSRACRLAGANHRVFLYPKSGTLDHFQFDCAEISE